MALAVPNPFSSYSFRDPIVLLPKIGICRNSPNPRITKSNGFSIHDLAIALQIIAFTFHDWLQVRPIEHIPSSSNRRTTKMVLRIDSAVEGQLNILRLSGRLDTQQLQQLKAQIAAAGHNVVLDLEDVQRVDVDAVSFLATCEATGVELRRCSRYLRNWITKEKTKQDIP